MNAGDPHPVCQVCGEAVSVDAAVACAGCQTLHHPDCWEWAGRCSTYGCGAAEGRALEAGEPTLDLPADSGASARRHRRRMRWLERVRRNPPIPEAASEVPAPRPVASLPAEARRAVAIRTGVVPLDLQTPLEWMLRAGYVGAIVIAVFALLLLFTAGANLGRAGVLNSLLCLIFATAAGIVGAVLAAATECRYELDVDRRRLVYTRRTPLPFLSARYEVAPFSDIHTATVLGSRRGSRYASWWEFWTVLVLRDGRILRVSDAGRGTAHARSNARKIAEVTGSRMIEGGRDTELVIRRAKGGLMVEQIPERWWIERHPYLAAVLGILGILVIALTSG